MARNNHLDLRRGLYTRPLDHVTVGTRRAEGTYNALTLRTGGDATADLVAITNLSRTSSRVIPPGSAKAGLFGLAASFDVGGSAETGSNGVAISWFGGSAVAGHEGIAVARRGPVETHGKGSASAGDFGVALGNPQGVAKVTEFGAAISISPIDISHGFASGGKDSVLLMQWFPSYSTDGSYRPRVAVAYVGENGILPDVVYTVDAQGNVIPKGPRP